MGKIGLDEQRAHCDPTRVQARLANVASGVAGAMMVNTSPIMNVVAVGIAKVAVVVDAANTILPTLVAFFLIA